MKISEPTLITLKHDITRFESQSSELNNWIKKKALKNEGKTSRTYVICQNNFVIGYYSLAAGSVSREKAIGKMKRNSPKDIPVMILGRLAIDKQREGQGLGSALLKDAILRTIQASDVIGIRAILVHALNETAKKFYEARGFKKSPINPLTLMLPLEEIKYNAGMK